MLSPAGLLASVFMRAHCACALLQDEPKKRAGGKRKQKEGAEQVGSADQG